LLEAGIVGNPEELSAQELHQRAWTLVQPRFQQEQKNAEAYYRQLAGADKRLACNEIERVVPAAYHGRVEFLFVAVGLQRWGAFDQATNAVRVHEEAEPGDEDLMDFAAVHTFLNGGTVYAVEPDHVPDDAPLAAVFRF
jgi:hypothetical protein